MTIQEDERPSAAELRSIEAKYRGQPLTLELLQQHDAEVASAYARQRDHKRNLKIVKWAGGLAGSTLAGFLFDRLLILLGIVPPQGLFGMLWAFCSTNL